MTLKEFRELLDTYGSDLGKWPQERRIAAVALIDGSDAAKQAFADACAFDAALRDGEGELSRTRRRTLIDGIMAAVDAADDPAEAAENPPSRPSESSPSNPAVDESRPSASELVPPEGSVEALALLLAGIVPGRARPDPSAQPQVEGSFRLLRQAIDDVVTGDRRREAQAILDRRRQACDEGLATLNPPDDGVTPDAATIGAAFLAGNLTEATVEISEAGLEDRLGPVLGGLLDLSRLLDRRERELFLAAIAAKLHE